MTPATATRHKVISLWDVAGHWMEHGIHEIPGGEDNRLIMAMLTLDLSWPDHDEDAWCAAFMGFCCLPLGVPRTGTLRARDWMRMGREVTIDEAEVGFDVCVFRRGPNSPGREVIKAPGHVGLFGGIEGDRVWCRGGNQKNTVSDELKNLEDLLMIVRLYE